MDTTGSFSNILKKSMIDSFDYNNEHFSTIIVIKGFVTNCDLDQSLLY